MNRRGFLKGLGLAATAATAVATVPELASTLFEPAWKTIHTEIAPVASPDVAGWVSYRYMYSVTLPPNRVSRIRYVDNPRSEVPNALPARNMVWDEASQTYVLGQDSKFV